MIMNMKNIIKRQTLIISFHHQFSACNKKLILN